MDPTTRMAYYSTSQTIPIARSISSPAAISASYEFLGIPVVTSYNPMEKAEEVIVQRDTQEFRGTTSMGEGLIRRLVDVDLEREGRRFEGLVWTRAPNEDRWALRSG
jgi:hypothetical protein